MTGIFKNIYDIKCCKRKGVEELVVDLNTRHVTKEYIVNLNLNV